MRQAGSNRGKTQTLVRMAQATQQTRNKEGFWYPSSLALSACGVRTQVCTLLASYQNSVEMLTATLHSWIPIHLAISASRS